ncbi:hypothetical protein [Brevundimonas sp.]|uniref:hypothetical protein n=1 Tax=Brevundimonas sp. TaxID=1871086 RepID=UPI00356498C5
MTKTFAAAAALAVLALAGTAAAQTAPAAPQTAPAAARPTINSPIKALLANPQTKAVMEKHMPGISEFPGLSQFENFTLIQIAPMSQGAVTEELINKIDTDLKALPAA